MISCVEIIIVDPSHNHNFDFHKIVVVNSLSVYFIAFLLMSSFSDGSRIASSRT